MGVHYREVLLYFFFRIDSALSDHHRWRLTELIGFIDDCTIVPLGP